MVSESAWVSHAAGDVKSDEWMIWSLRPFSRFKFVISSWSGTHELHEGNCPQTFSQSFSRKKTLMAWDYKGGSSFTVSNCWSDSCDPTPVGVSLFGWLHYQSLVFLHPKPRLAQNLTTKHTSESMWYLWWLSQRHIRRNTSIDSKIKGTQWRLLLLGSYLLHSLFCEIMWFFSAVFLSPNTTRLDQQDRCRVQHRMVWTFVAPSV